MLFIKKLKNNSPSRWSGKTRNWEKMDTIEFHGLKVMRNFVRPNDVGWPSGRGDNYPETYRSWFYDYYGFIGELLLLGSPSLVHLEIIRRSYVVSDTTALPRVSTSTQSLFTHLLALLLRKGFWAFIIIATRSQRPALQRFTCVWATDLTSSFYRCLIPQTVIPSSGNLISLGILDFGLSIPSFQGRSWHSTS